METIEISVQTHSSPPNWLSDCSGLCSLECASSGPSRGLDRGGSVFVASYSIIALSSTSVP